MLAVTLAFITGCETTTESVKLAELQNEISELKQVQRQVAIKVGLADLVRPEAISLSDEGVLIGSDSAKIIMLEYTDLHCPYCKKFQQDIWPEFKEKFVDSEEVAVIAREFPLATIHPKAPYAAVMLRCANEQGKYETVKDQLFQIGNSLDQQAVAKVISENALDTEKFNVCLEDKNTHNVISRSLKEGMELGLASTPAFIIGRKQGNKITDYEIVTGAKPLSYFTTVIERLKENN